MRSHWCLCIGRMLGASAAHVRALHYHRERVRMPSHATQPTGWHFPLLPLAAWLLAPLPRHRGHGGTSVRKQNTRRMGPVLTGSVFPERCLRSGNNQPALHLPPHRCSTFAGTSSAASPRYPLPAVLRSAALYRSTAQTRSNIVASRLCLCPTPMPWGLPMGNRRSPILG